MKALRTTLTKIALLGLTPQELEGSKAQIYGGVLRSRLNVEPEFLKSLIEGLPEGLGELKMKSPTKSGEHADLAPVEAGSGQGMY